MYRFTTCGAVLALVLATVQAEEAGLGLLPEEGVLLLRTGHTVQGRITRVGDLYRVAVPNGEIRIKVAEVELLCRDLEDGYRRKRAACQHGSVFDHLQLADWCLRQGLLSHAARELADAMDADPRHPTIAVLQRRLRTAMEPPPKPAEPAKLDEGSQTPTPEELDQLIRSLAPQAVEDFTHAVQPVLMNHCATAGCHGPGAKGEYRLLRAPVGKAPTRLLTQRNLSATLQWVDRQNPAESRLLTAAREPHGPTESPVFAEHQASQYQRLAQWVDQLAQRPTPNIPATVDGRAENLPLSSTPAARFQGFPPVKAEHIPPAKDEKAAQPTPPDSPMPSVPESPDARPGNAGANGVPDSSTPAPGNSRVKRGAPLPPGPVDPFDAEVFNRRFFGGK